MSCQRRGVTIALCLPKSLSRRKVSKALDILDRSLSTDGRSEIGLLSTNTQQQQQGRDAKSAQGIKSFVCGRLRGPQKGERRERI